MYMSNRPRGIFLAGLLLLTAVPTQTHAEPSIDALRRLMTDSRFIGLVSPCTTGGSTRTTAAEWLRTAFHDAAPHDASSGTGGIDGSVMYEFGWPSNGGDAIPSTVRQYESFRQPGVTLADLVVLGAISAVGACGGSIVPFRAGRNDVNAADVADLVPLPEQSLATHQSMFARMGFNQEEMISLVACGHTIGGVHSSASPDLTSSKFASFDSTRAKFDNLVAREYLNNSLINPLAQPYDINNPGRSSDARIFESDDNSTISAYANNENAFQAGCARVFRKMYDEAVPYGTSLTSRIEPFPVSLGFTVSLRADSLKLNIGSARIHNMVGQWKSLDIVWEKRDGSPGDDQTFFRRTPRTISNGKPIELMDFSTRGAIDPTTGIRAAKVLLTLNDGSIYRSGAADGQEIMLIDDSILVNTGVDYSCSYSSSSPAGLNVTVAVLGPYRASDKVSLLTFDSSDSPGSPIAMDYRSPRQNTPYHYYGIFVPDGRGIVKYGARVVRADGTVSEDTSSGLYYRVSGLNDCPASAIIPVAGPRPSSISSSSNVRRAASQCPSTFEYCPTLAGWSCVDTQRELTSCGGCVLNGRGRDCSEMSLEDTAAGEVRCVKGACVIDQHLGWW